LENASAPVGQFWTHSAGTFCRPSAISWWKGAAGQAHVETTAYEGQAKLLARQAPLESFLWSSYGQYLKGPKERPPWLRVDRLLGLRLQPAEDNKLALE